MTREEFDDLVRSVEKRFADRPVALRWRVIMLAGLGYAGLLAWLGVVVLISTGFFMLAVVAADLEVKIALCILGAFILFGGGYAVLRALLVTVSKPEGQPVTRAEAPELFKVLDELQGQLRCPPFDQVLIESVCNAAVSQVPRLGALGWHRKYLLIGLPLLDGLSRDEMRAVLAHEFTHLSREHGRLTHWLYRLRRSWDVAFQRLSAPRVRGEFSLRPLVVKFIEFFWPRFNAHAFVLSRANEYEADAQSARLAGKNNAASALMRLDIVSRQLDEKLWPDVHKLANEQAQAPEDVFVRLRDGIRAGPTAEESAKWREESLKMVSTNSDTHPCLTERLRALEVAPDDIACGPVRQSAAEALLGQSLDAVRVGVQKFWAKETAQNWRDRHARATALKDRLTSLDQVPILASADVDRLWDKAAAVLDLEGGKAAKPLLEEIIKLRPDHAPARFHLGRLLLEDNSVEGVTHLQRAMELDQQCFPHACALLHDHYRHAGDTARLRELDARMDRHQESLTASQAERREVKVSDTLIPHELSEAELLKLREGLERESGILRAHLARKEMKYFPTQKMFVLCVYPRRAWHGLANHDADRALVNRLSQKLQLPGRLMVFTPSGSFRALSRKLARLSDVEIFRRGT
jgi:Zn-dependent protease with chaperone function